MIDRQKLWGMAVRAALASAFVVMVQVEAQAFQAPTTIFLVRHAEAVDGEDPGLSSMGRERAAALVHAFEDVALDAIHSTPLNRTLETAGPTAEHHGLEIIRTDPTGTFAEDMANMLRTNHVGETVLVVSHSNTVPAIINALGGGPLEDLPHDEYDALFLVTMSGDETRVLRMQYGRETP